jgi:lysophospholipase L1-like esterase
MLAGVDVVLCTLLPRVGPCGDEASPTTEGFNEWLRFYADQMDIPLIDIHEDFLSTDAWEQVYFGADCLHPNANGIQRIAELIEDKIREIYLPTF